MSAEPSQKVSDAVDFAVRHAVTETRKELQAEYQAALSRLKAEHEAEIRELLLQASVAVGEQAAALLSPEERDAVAREREEIAKLLESMTTEWRAVPTDGDPNRFGGRLRDRAEVTAGGVQIPTTLPTPAEVWVLELAARRVRARSK